MRNGLSKRLRQHVSLPCPLCGEYNPPNAGGYDDMGGKLNHRVPYLIFNCPKHDKYYLRAARVMDMDL